MKEGCDAEQPMKPLPMPSLHNIKLCVVHDVTLRVKGLICTYTKYSVCSVDVPAMYLHFPGVIR